MQSRGGSQTSVVVKQKGICMARWRGMILCRQETGQ